MWGWILSKKLRLFSDSDWLTNDGAQPIRMQHKWRECAQYARAWEIAIWRLFVYTLRFLWDAAIIIIFVFHRQTLIEHKSLQRLSFWACNTSFKKLVSRTFRCQRDLVMFTKKNSSEERLLLIDICSRLRFEEQFLVSRWLKHNAEQKAAHGS